MSDEENKSTEIQTLETLKEVAEELQDADETNETDKLSPSDVDYIRLKIDRAADSVLREKIREKIREDGRIRTVPRRYPDQPKILGCYVKDRVTQFEGIVTSFIIHLTGCNRLVVLDGHHDPRGSMMLRETPLPKAVEVDEASCDILAYSELLMSPNELGEQDRGGPVTRTHGSAVWRA
jgi:hypothetical protein